MWEDVYGFVLALLSFLGSLLYLTIDSVRLWAYENPAVIYTVGCAAIACGVAALVLRHVWRRWLRDKAKPLYWRYIQRPMHRVLGPVRRHHRRWSERNMEKKMAKWKAGVLADIVGDALLEACIIGTISDQEYRKYMEKMGHSLDLPDLIRIRNSKLAIAHRIRKQGQMMGLLDNNNKVIKQTPPAIPGGKPGEDIVPQHEGLGDKLLARLLKAS